MYRILCIFICVCTLVFQSSVKAVSYDELKTSIDMQRKVYTQQYSNLASKFTKTKLLTKSADELHSIVTRQLAPHWYGTQWDYYGTSQEPGKGSIACGYFVTTVLRDAGLNLERVRLAQQASENIIKSLVSKKSIRRYSNKPIKSFLKDAHEWGEGLYVVGLDNHVGFLSIDKEGIDFIHSSYLKPAMVIIEPAAEARILASSKYRVLGKFNDKKLLKAWITNSKIPTVTKSIF